jgi:DNA-binding transcriptional LysR family regulator
MISKQQAAFRLLELSNTFLILYESRDIALAARQLSVSITEVEARIQELEKKMDIQLFANQDDYGNLTADGKRYYDRVANSIESIKQLKKSPSQND